MLACARIGAVHSVVFGGFSPAVDRRPHRRLRQQARDHRRRRPARRQAHAAEGERRRGAANCPAPTTVETVLVVRHTGGAVPMQMPRDRWYDAVVDGQPDTCEPARMNAEDPLFILYTSGSTGKPKGVLHTTGGYLVWAAYTHEMRVRPQARTTSTGAPPTSAGSPATATSSTGRWPTARTTRDVRGRAELSRHASRFWEVIDKHQVTIFYTAPTAIRALMREGDAPVQAHLAQVAAPARHGRRADQPGSLGAGTTTWSATSRCPIVDTWWQTETGGILISPLPGADRPQARLGHAAVLRRAAGAGRCGRHRAGRRDRGQPGAARFLAGTDAHGVRRPPALHRHLLQDLPGHVLHRRRLPPRRLLGFKMRTLAGIEHTVSVTVVEDIRGRC